MIQTSPTAPAALVAPGFAPLPAGRPRVAGKFLYAGEYKLYIRGVTYGTFGPNPEGGLYPCPTTVARDFAAMCESGVNSVRVYTVPPRWLLDLAEAHGLRVLVGLPWEQHVAFLDDPGRAAGIRRAVRDGVRAVEGHPALLGYAVGNEIPASIVRWHGRRRVARFLSDLAAMARDEDPGALITYSNYPTTEYLELPFLDFVTFNVYLEAPAQFAAYLARLQNLACDRPLVLGEVGLDSRRNGLAGQAAALDWQVRAAFAGGCAGLFVFAWTDEWARGGVAVDDWDFGLTDRDRRPKPALAAVEAALAAAPLAPDASWPDVSVVVCSHNGARTLGECLAGVGRLTYPRYEVIVVDDGSTDDTAAIAAGYDCRVVRTPHRGLSHARNAGLEAATGEIIAYLDDDAWPDPDWLTYLAATFRSATHAGVGGPNLAPPGDGAVAACVAQAPGSPTHVLLTDTVAEHLPGCNMAFRRARLLAVGGFDVRFRTAGDDVDLCWRIQQQGGTLGFSPGAVVWHHRRGTVRGYWRQQVGYGVAEAQLERKWPGKYNRAGHVRWRGRVYDPGLPRRLAWGRTRVYGGVWGSAPFQSLYGPGGGGWAEAPLMPEWYLVILGVAALSALSLLWRPLLALPWLALALAAPLAEAGVRAARARFPDRPRPAGALRLLTLSLYLLQPLARLTGRLRAGLAPWRPVRGAALAPPRVWTARVWREAGQEPAGWLRALAGRLAAAGAAGRPGGAFDDWDLQVRGGALGGARLLLAVEEHGAGRQLARVRAWPAARVGVLAAAGPAILALLAALDGAPAAGLILAIMALALAGRTLYECAAALGQVRAAVQGVDAAPPAGPP